MIKNKAIALFIAAGMTAGITACGGGGGGGSPSEESQNPSNPSAAPAQTGQFIDSPVEGLTYQAEPSGLTGVTNEHGHFKFREGDRVSFKLGAIDFGQAVGKKTVTPVDLVEDAKGSVENAEVINIARMLQSLDSDSDPANGITITDETRSAAEQLSSGAISFKQGEFESTAGAHLQTLAGEKAVLVDEGEAKEHLRGNLFITSCDDQNAVSATFDRLVGIRGHVNGSEAVLSTFNGDGSYSEFSNDHPGYQATTNEGTWNIKEDRLTLTDQFETDVFVVCDVGTALLYADTDGKRVSRVADIAPFNADTVPGTYKITFKEDEIAYLELKADGMATLRESGVVDANWSVDTEGVLTVEYSNAKVEVSRLAGYTTPTAVYVEKDLNGELTRVGGMVAVADFVETDKSIFSGKTLVWLGDTDVVITQFQEDGRFREYTNDYRQNGVQFARYYPGEWTFVAGEVTLARDNGDTETFGVEATETSVIYKDDEGKASSLSRVAPFTEAGLVGSYTVTIPTENSVENVLVFNEDKTCTYSATKCTWSLDAAGVAVIKFPGKNETAHLWRLADRHDVYAFLIIHPDDLDDVEPGTAVLN